MLISEHLTQDTIKSNALPLQSLHIHHILYTLLLTIFITSLMYSPDLDPLKPY